MKTLAALRLVLAAAFISWLAVGHSAEANKTVSVITALPVTYSVAHALAEGTNITVHNVPKEGRRMNALARYLEKPGDEVLRHFETADAVITIGKLWREDPLYAAVRARNIRVVNIDATEPYSATLPGVALVSTPSVSAPWEQGAAEADDRRPLIHFWLSLSNTARMADIIAHDFAQLSPPDAARISQNLTAYRRQLFELKSAFEARSAQLENVTVFALTPEFAYLTNDVGLFVDGYFVKQDIDWTEADLRNLCQHLTDHDVRVVIHKWEPSEAIQKAIRDAGAQLVVLDTLEERRQRDGSTDAYLTRMKVNLEALQSALAAASSR